MIFIKKTDNSAFCISTLQYKEYEICILGAYNQISARSYNIDNKVKYKTKMDIFKDTLKLGEVLFKHMENLEISQEITMFIDTNNTVTDNLAKGILKIEFHNNIPTEIFNFNNLDLHKIFNNKEVKNSIINWLNIYGIPSVPEDIYYDIEHKDSIDDSEYINRLYKEHCWDISPLIQFSIFLYLIYNLTKCITEVKTRFLNNNKYLNPFPFLKNEYEDLCTNEHDEFEYDNEFGRTVNEYIKTLIRIVNVYLKTSLNLCNDEIEIIYSDIDLPSTKEESKTITIDNFFQTKYLLRNPIFYTFMYLCQVLSNKNFKPLIYYCDNCNEILDNDTVLCISCKKSYGNHFLDFHKKKIEKIKMRVNISDKQEKIIEKSNYYIKCLKNELDKIKEDGICETPTIIELYRNNRDQHNHYNKQKNITNCV